MAKSSALCFLFFLLFIVSLGGDKMVAEAKHCLKTWNCNTTDICWDDCKSRYGGKGLCDLIPTPFVPKQCLCSYEC
ncbi:unnamed protein product [Linum trigynum]|uniref:Uncharacterized protein n=2 Tax=Linum TaxID=4005 RepID=A0AAV2D0M4_9ROSI